ncbi:MAG: 50S ribosomal protein L17 [Ignavibacteria bacterium CG_4_8_14_3_um_filter_37_9]|nr:50S ribosomal protein L17 [Ignavibacteria bacterium]OIO24121.1 MAG: 50S ribosomal protein L17 [Ignavibacteria bacterium CG1_02_37_35]PIS44757.1 MAG: 50S ribosomal protein L17 [Ignavibacteria bacterium CG08_land_8_20_14_0_20_37_9]PIW98296.1 MAG: 50S ribosomal protein L17 [Ignavibacteria bacterium CG_4_8_14_3_um_filter_37_9]PIX95473.1 MAG: 50S ribosomal protein L17 [Ignavibacteria bacterium CG_4_10_14_3_um_filter_37_18]
MRHSVKGRKLKRTASHKSALLRNLTTSLLKYKRIRTTVAKAKELRTYVEPLLTKAIAGDLHNQKMVMDSIKDKEVVKELFSSIVPTLGERKGGYTRVVKLGRRLGDGAEIAIIELVDYNEAANQKAVENKEKKEAKGEAKKVKAASQDKVEDAKVVEETVKEKK